MNVILDGREVKVGDNLYDLVHGWVKIEQIDTLDTEMPIYARDSRRTGWWYYNNGGYTEYGNRVLYWGRPEIIPPALPKRTVKKWLWILRNNITTRLEVSENYYSTADDVLKTIGNLYRRV